MNSVSTLLYLDMNEYGATSRGIYKSIVTVRKPVNGPLASYIVQLRQNKLSAFHIDNLSCNCIYAVRSLKDNTSLMLEDEIDTLLEFLIDNNYTINTEITTLINNNHRLKRSPNQKNLICYFN